MERTSEQRDDRLIDLGAVSVETRGAGPQPRTDSLGNFGDGLSDD